jgi:hypothetical protein
MRGLFVAALVLFVWCDAAVALAPAGVGCAPTAEAAVARILNRDAGPESVNGFKVISLRRDPLRNRNWVMVASCNNAARPMVAIELVDDRAEHIREMPKVRIGDRVSVVSVSDASRMELVGVAEDSGTAQDLIRVRLPKFSSDETLAAPVIHCRVIGADLVEVVR